MTKQLLIFFVISLTIFVNLLLLNHFIADIFQKKSLTLYTSDLNKSLNYANKSLQKDSKNPYYYKTRSLIYALIANQVPISEKSYYQNKAYSDLEIGYYLNKNDPTYVRESLHIYYLLALAKNNLPYEDVYKVVARKYFNDLKIKYSTDVGTIVNIATYEKRLNLQDDFSTSLSKIYELRPDLLDWYPGLIN